MWQTILEGLAFGSGAACGVFLAVASWAIATGGNKPSDDGALDLMEERNAIAACINKSTERIADVLEQQASRRGVIDCDIQD